jgi:hypothetical protein
MKQMDGTTSENELCVFDEANQTSAGVVGEQREEVGGQMGGRDQGVGWDEERGPAEMEADAGSILHAKGWRYDRSTVCFQSVGVQWYFVVLRLSK